MRKSHRETQDTPTQGSSTRRALRGNAQEIYVKRLAATLDEALATHQVVTKVGMRQQDNLLYIALEPAVKGSAETRGNFTVDELLDPRSLLPTLQTLLTKLQLPWLKLAKISARLSGQSAPLWQDELLFQKAAPIANTLMNPVPSETSTAAISDVNVHIGGQMSGQMSGQMVIGNNNHQEQYAYTYNVATGGVLNIAEKSTVRARPTPLKLRPRRFENLLDRQTVLPVIRESLWQSLPVEVYAEQGFGKTALMRHVVHDEQLVSVFPDGVVYLCAHRQLAEDLLQSLYDVFYESSPPLKPSYGQVQQSLRRKRALVILNHLSFDKEEMEWLLATLPECTFVLVSAERVYWQDGSAIALKGLPFDESITLMQIELGRSLTDDEQLTAKSLWNALSGNPLHLRRAAAQVRESERSLVDLVQSMQTKPGQVVSARSLFQQALSKLTPRQKAVLGLMGAMGGVALSAEQAAAITQEPETAEILSELANLHLIEPCEPITFADGLFTGAADTIRIAENSTQTAYQLSSDLTQLVQKSVDPRPWLAKATDYFVQHAGHIEGNTDAMLHLLEWTQQTGRWQESLALARSLDYSLTLSGQWARWQQVLTDSVQAAEQLGDEAAKAWALHQMGTRAIALGETANAESWLSRSLQLREQLGDAAGAAVTRHNLGLLVVPLLSGMQGAPFSQNDSAHYSPGAKRSARRLIGSRTVRRALPWGAAVLLGGLIVGGVSSVLLRERSDQQPSAIAVELSNTAIEFGAQRLNTVSEADALTMTNTGNAPIQIRQLFVAGAGDFELALPTSADSDCSVVPALGVGEGCEIKPVFMPTEAGEHTAKIVVVATLAESNTIVETQLEPVVLSGIGLPEDKPTAGTTPRPSGIRLPQSLPSIGGVSGRPNPPAAALPPTTNASPERPTNTSTPGGNTSVDEEPVSAPTEPTTEPTTEPDPPQSGATNRAPVAINYNLTIQQGEPLTLDLLSDAFDPDPGDTVKVLSVANLEVGGRLENNGDGTVTYVHWEDIPDGQVGSYSNSFEYSLTDGKGGVGIGTISITVVVPPPAAAPLPAEPLPEEPPLEEPLPGDDLI